MEEVTIHFGQRLIGQSAFATQRLPLPICLRFTSIPASVHLRTTFLDSENIGSQDELSQDYCRYEIDETHPCRIYHIYPDLVAVMHLVVPLDLAAELHSEGCGEK